LASGCCDTSPPHFATGLTTLETAVQATNPVRLADLDDLVVDDWTLNHPDGEPKTMPRLELEKLKAKGQPFPLPPDFSPRKRLEDEIKLAQCLAGTANPFIPVFTGAFSIALQGSFTDTAGASGTAPVWGGTLSASFSVSKQQGITVPVTFVTVINVANFYFGQVMAYFPNASALLTWAPPADAAHWPPTPAAPWAGGSAAVPSNIGSLSPPPVPGSQLAQVQAVFAEILKTRETISGIATTAIRNGVPSPAACVLLRTNGFLPPAGATFE
jgi:hypothetical protein